MENVKGPCYGEHKLVALGKGQHTSNLEGGRGLFVPKEKGSSEINQFCTISLLSVEAKIFLSVLAWLCRHFH